MVNIEEFNHMRQIKLINDIMSCNGDYQLFCIDVDDVVYNTDAVMQEILATIDYRATKKYREKISIETSEDSLSESEKSFAILNAILEETPYTEDMENGAQQTLIYPKIDYSKVYKSEHLIPGSIEFINHMLQKREKNYFFIYLSHRNPIREGYEKMLKLYELTPNIDAIITLPYHIETGSKEVNSKALWVKQSLALENLNNCILIDNSRSNCKDWRKQGGIDIRYLTDGVEQTHSINNHLLKLTSLDPYYIQFVLSYIKYIRQNTSYTVVDLDNNFKEKVLKK